MTPAKDATPDVGLIVVVAGLLTPVLGTERVGAAFTWFSRQGPRFVRAVTAFPVIIGLFLVYAINPARRRA